VVVFFSVSGSKLPAYVLPAFPPLALVLGLYLAQAPERRLAWLSLPNIVVAVALAVLAWRLPSQGKDAWTQAMYLDARPWALAGAAVFATISLVVPWLLRRGRRWIALTTVAIGMVLVIDCIEDAYESLAPRQSGAMVAARMRPLLAPDTRLYSVGHYEQTIPFYLGRTMTLVAYVDEFETGLKSEPQRAIATLEAFVPAWERPGEALAIMHPDTFQTFRARGLPMQVLHDDPRRVLVRKP
jgi:4-amino-4-deoxy-L-arabinose transferase-like glycosyltransferase